MCYQCLYDIGMYVCVLKNSVGKYTEEENTEISFEFNIFLNVSIILLLSHSTSAGESAKKKKKKIDRLNDRLLQKTNKNKLKIFTKL